MHSTSFPRAQALFRARRFDEAAEVCRQILASQPLHEEALGLVQAVSVATGNLKPLETAVKKARKVNAKSPVVWLLLSFLADAKGNGREAGQCLRKALKARPNYPQALQALANFLIKAGQDREALEPLHKLAHLLPGEAGISRSIGVIHEKLNELDKAEDFYGKACSLKPGYAEAWAMLANVLRMQGKTFEAEEAYGKALAIEPKDGTRIKLAALLPVIPFDRADITHWRDRFLIEFKKLEGRPLRIGDPMKEAAITNFLLAYHGQDNKAHQKAVAQCMVRACPDLTYAAPHCCKKRTGGNRLKIGIISQYFRAHTIGRLFRGMVEHLDREKFEVTVLTFASPMDTERKAILDAADHVVMLPIDLAQARQAIASKELDILFYTDIGMDPATYLLSYARLAPLQCVACGHPDTTGVGNVDAFVVSTAVEPEESASQYWEEQIRVEGSSLFVHRPALPETAMGRAEFGLPDGPLFLCPQTPFKFHPDFDDALLAILRRARNARLVLLRLPPENCADLLFERLKRTGGEECERIVFLPPVPASRFVDLIRACDVVLDPIHYSGGYTSLEAFAVGRPIVTLPGDFSRGRWTHGFYSMMGIDLCTAGSAEEYVDIAVNLIEDEGLRSEVSRQILANNGVLFESHETIRSLEQGLIAQYEKIRV